jgi:hypothetical protein
MKFIFENFKTEVFHFDPDTCMFEGTGKGIRGDAEQENIALWFADCVDHGALALYSDPADPPPHAWQVRALPKVNGGIVQLDEAMTLETLLTEFVEIFSTRRLREACVVVLKGKCDPRVASLLLEKLKKQGARDDLLLVQLPDGIDLSMVPE